MSIRDNDDNEIVHLPGMWEVLAKFAFGASVPVLLLGVSWAIWVTSNTWQNTTDIRVLESRLNSAQHPKSVATAKPTSSAGGE